MREEEMKRQAQLEEMERQREALKRAQQQEEEKRQEARKKAEREAAAAVEAEARVGHNFFLTCTDIQEKIKAKFREFAPKDSRNIFFTFSCTSVYPVPSRDCHHA